MKRTYTRRQLILIITLVALAISLFFLFDITTKNNQQQYLQLTTERYQLAYNTVYDQYKQLSKTLNSEIIKRFNIPEMYRKLLTADAKQKDKLREELLLQIMPRYEVLKKTAKVRQLHFHLQNNESFLRLHRPEKFGDNLTDARATVNFVNTKHSPIDGFEEGKIYNGYRFMFPITDVGRHHLGSMEISFGPETIAQSLMEQYGVLCNFFIKKHISENRVFSEELKKNYTQSVYGDYLWDNNVIAALKKISGQSVKNLAPEKETTKKLLASALSGRATSLYDHSLRRIITTIPVINPVTREVVAFFTIRSLSVRIEKELQHFRIIFSLIFLLLSIISFIFYLQHNKKQLLKTSKEQLEIQKKRLMEAQHIANLGHWEFDVATECLSWSDQLHHIFGLQTEEHRATIDFFWERAHPDDRELVRISYEEAVKTGIPYDIQHRIIAAGDVVKWVRHLCTITYDKAGKPLRSLGVIHDITVQKMQEKLQLQVIQQQEELKRFDSLKTMAGAIAHRFNTAMTVVMCNLDLITDTLPAHSDEYEMASDALQAATGASQVGTMMLSYVGQQSLTLQELPLEDLARESATALKNLLLPPVSLQFAPPEQPLFCSVDRQQINEVIKSILTNAVESLDSQAGIIEITFGTDTFTGDFFSPPFQNNNLQNGVYTFCQIKDSGHGISPANISRIFEPFYTTRFVGRGLGLALTVGIMQRHHGAITVKSSPDKGTTVRILFPAVPSSQPPAVHT